MDFPVRIYPDVRESLQTGDVVTFDSDELLGRAIRLFAGQGTHTAMVMRLQDAPGRLFLLEAQAPGLVNTILSKRVSNYDGRVYVTRCPATDDQRAKIALLGLNLIGSHVKYDYWSLLMNALHRVPLCMDRGYCTESVQYILQEAGVLPVRTLAMIPNDFLHVPWETVQLAAFTLEGE